MQDPDAQVQVRLGLEEEIEAPAPADDVDDEVGGEDERLEQDEGPHVRLAGHEARRRVRDVSHRESSGNGPVPKSSRKIMRRIRVRKTLV